MALFDVAQLQAQLKPLYNDFAYQYADEIAARARANMVYGNTSLKGTRNTGERIRRITGLLFKSLDRNGAGNIYEMKQTDTGFTVTYGSRVPYARIHEYGGTIRHPGGTPYFIKNGELIFVRKRNPIAARLPKTKPHPIRIPARPYLTPALREFEQSGKREFSEKIKFIIAMEMQKWLAKQKR